MHFWNFKEILGFKKNSRHFVVCYPKNIKQIVSIEFHIQGSPVSSPFIRAINKWNSYEIGPWFGRHRIDKRHILRVSMCCTLFSDSQAACANAMMNDDDFAYGNEMRSKDSVTNQIFANISSGCNENSKNAIKFKCKFLNCTHCIHSNPAPHTDSHMMIQLIIVPPCLPLWWQQRHSAWHSMQFATYFAICNAKHLAHPIELAYWWWWWLWWLVRWMSSRTSILFMMRFESDTTVAILTNKVKKKWKRVGPERDRRGGSDRANYIHFTSGNGWRI